MADVTIHVPDYDPHRGTLLEWDDDHRIRVDADGAKITIEANPAGLRSLARHLLTLAQEEGPADNHLHLDESNGLDEGSDGLTIVRAGIR